MLLSDYFDTLPNRIISIIGCGGKTSLLWFLAKHYCNKKVLVTTTTHIHCPQKEEGLFDYFFDGSYISAKKGITLALSKDDEKGRNRPLPPALLNSIMNEYDHVLIEADGSRSKPLKGWESYEPVVIESTTLTVGVLSFMPLGLPVSGELVHRLHLFKELTGAEEGQKINTEHFFSMITGERYKNNNIRNKGLFAESRGKKILFFNQVEDNDSLETAKETAFLLKESECKIDGIIAGSIKHNTADVLTYCPKLT